MKINGVLISKLGLIFMIMRMLVIILTNDSKHESSGTQR